MKNGKYYLLVTASDRMGGSPSMDYIEESEISEQMLNCPYYSIYKKIDKKGFLKKKQDKEMSAIRQLQSEIQELQRWKNEMLLVESRWDKQKVGRLLGVGWGQDICPNIEPGIIKKNKEIENLRECLKEIRATTQWNWDIMPEEGRKNCFKLIESMSDEALKQK